MDDNVKKLTVSVEELRKNRILVATPMYAGQCFGLYTKAAIDLATYCAKLKIPIKFRYIYNESLITRARNYLADDFLRSDYTHLVFIDSDMYFSPNDVLSLIALNKDIVGGPYPKKAIAWENVKVAVEAGLADGNPLALSKYTGEFAFNPVEGTKEIKLDRPLEVSEVGTGFVAINRESLIKYMKAYPKLRYKPAHSRTKNFDGSREICAFFDTMIDPESKRYLSEDYMFCQNARKAGLKVYLCPWMKLYHIGTYIFESSLVELAKLHVPQTIK